MVSQDNLVVYGGKESSAKVQAYTERGSIMEGALRLLSGMKAAADLFLTSGQERERARCECI